MSIVPRGLFDQIYGIDLGNMGAPVEPAIPGNPLPYLINSEIPTTSDGVSGGIPPEIVEIVEEAMNNDSGDDTIVYQTPLDIEGQDGGDGWPSAQSWSSNSVPLPEQNPLNPTIYGNNKDNTIDAYQTISPEDEDRSVASDDRVADYAAGTGNIGFDQNMTEAALDAIARNPAVGAVDTISATQLGGVPQSINDTIGEITGLMNDPLAVAMTGGIQSPQSSQVATNAGSIEDQASSQAGSVLSSDPASPANQALGAMMIADLANRDTDAELNARANAALAARGAGPMTADQLAGGFSSISPEAEPAAQEPEPTIDVPTIAAPAPMSAAPAVGGLTGGQQAAVPDYSMGGLAQSLAGRPSTQVQGASFSAPVGRTTEISPPAPTLATNPGRTGMFASPGLAAATPGRTGGFANPGMASTFTGPQNNAGSIEDQAAADLGARAAPATNPGNVAAYGALGGFGLADALTEAELSEAEKSAAEARSTLNGMTPISDPNASISLPGLVGSAPAPMSPMSRAPGIEGFVSGLFGNTETGRQAFTNPSMQLDDLVQQELTNYDPYANTGVQSLGSHAVSRSSTGTSNADIAAEVDAMNGASLVGGEYGMIGGPSYGGAVQGSQGLGGGTIGGAINTSFGSINGFGNDDEDDENSIGGFSSSDRSSGVAGTTIGNVSSNVGSFSGPTDSSTASNPFSGISGFGSVGSNVSDNFGFSSIDGFGDFASAGAGMSIGGFSGDTDGGFSTSMGGLGGFSNGGFSDDGSFGGGGFGGFSGDTGGVGGSPGSQSDDTGNASSGSGIGNGGIGGDSIGDDTGVF